MGTTRRAVWLSIDLDAYHGGDADMLAGLVHAAKDAGTPSVLVKAHQQLLPFVDRAPADILVNIDEHDDLFVKRLKRPACCEWACHVAWASKGTYAWMHRGWGSRCDPNDHLWKKNGKGWGGWRACWDRPLEDGDEARLLSRAVALGICVSPNYCDRKLAEALSPVLGFPMSWFDDRTSDWGDRASRRPVVLRGT